MVATTASLLSQHLRGASWPAEESSLLSVVSIVTGKALLHSTWCADWGNHSATAGGHPHPHQCESRDVIGGVHLSDGPADAVRCHRSQARTSQCCGVRGRIVTSPDAGHALVLFYSLSALSAPSQCSLFVDTASWSWALLLCQWVCGSYILLGLSNSSPQLHLISTTCLYQKTP